MAEESVERNEFSIALDESENVSERFRGLMHEVFDGIYNGLGKNNFLRWIDTRRISDRIKQLVVEEFSKEEEQSKPHTLGFYTSGTNIEKLRSGNINLQIAIHETLHFLTDSTNIGTSFSTYINEGITEYLNREFAISNGENKNDKYLYSKNVDFVEFLHKTLGDSLIKAYLTCDSKTFTEEFSIYFTPDGKPNPKVLENFYNALDVVHYLLYQVNNTQNLVEQKKIDETEKYADEKCYPIIKKHINNLIPRVIRKKARDLEYYSDGTLNLEQVIDDINDLKKNLYLLKKHNALDYSLKEFGKLEQYIYQLSLSFVLKESHMQLSTDEILHMVSDLIVPMAYKENEGQPSLQSAKINKEKLSQIQELINGKGTDEELIAHAKTLLDKRLENNDRFNKDGHFNITAFIMDASLVLDKMGIKDNLRQVFLDSIMFRYLPKDVNRDLVKNLIDKHSKLYVALYQKQQYNKQNVVDSKFIKISDTKFIEKRDNKIFFLDFDEKTGSFSEQEVTNPGYQIMGCSKEVIDRFGGAVNRRVHSEKDAEGKNKDYKIMYNDDFSMVEVNGKSYEVLASPEKLGDSILIEEAMNPILEGIKESRYVSILEDGEEPIEGASYAGVIPDTCSRVINYKLFLQELEDTIKNVPVKFREGIKNDALAKLISQTYFIKPDNMEKILDDIQYIISNGKDSMGNIEKLYKITQELNQARRNYIEQASRDTWYTFKKPEDEEKWKISLEGKKQREKQKQFWQSVNSFVNIDSIACIVEPLEVRTDEEHYSTMKGVKYLQRQTAKYKTPATNKVDYDNFCDRLIIVASTIDEDKRVEFIKSVIEKSVDLWYGYADVYSNPKADEISDERDTMTSELVYAFTNRIINGSDSINLERIAEIEKRFIELSEQQEHICQEVLERREPSGFENEEVKRNYETIKLIHNMDAPEETKKETIKTLKENNNIAYKKKRAMNAFGRLALSGENIPSADDILKATNILIGYKDFDRD